MKKLYVNSVSILFAVLCLVFTACNGMTAGKGTGTVRVVIGGGATRSVDPASGLPVFDKDNTTITVTKADGTKVVDGEKETEKTLQLPVDTKITVEVKVTTAAGEWSGSKEYTVTAGDNPITVTLSKTPKTMRNILVDVVEQNTPGDPKVTLKLASGKTLVPQAVFHTYPPHEGYPVTARDNIGRIYVLYTEPTASHSISHFKRFDVEGNEDTNFETAIKDKLPTSFQVRYVAVDAKNNRLFLFGHPDVYCLQEKEDKSFELLGSGTFISTPPKAAAAYNGVLFAVTQNDILYAGQVTFEDDPSAAGGKRLNVNSIAQKALDKLRPSDFSNDPFTCTGLFADEHGAYALLTQNSADGKPAYTVGALDHYTYAGSALTRKNRSGLHPKAPSSELADSALAFDAECFACPVGFIGSDENNIYIADDGTEFQYVNENWHVKTHHNRIAAFNRKSETGSLTFTSANARWYSEVSPYKIPNTPVLLWEKYRGTEHPVPYQGMRYWTSADGTEAFSESNKLFEITDTASEGPTDVFCYDQDGNLYILWQDSSNYYRVRRFELKNGASYAATREDSPPLDSSLLTPSYIAVDFSGWQNYLYCGYKDITNDWKVERMSWIGNLITLTPLHAEWSITVGSDSSKKLTALAANKDGVFVAVKETYQDGSIEKYRLKVQKYSKETGAAAQGEIMVDNSVTVGVRPAASPYNDYTEADTSITGLQVVKEQLYAIAATEERLHKYKSDIPDYVVDVFKHSSVLYKLPKTKDTFSGSIAAENSHKKNAGDEIGYGFCRFIAVKPKKLVIASDSGWGKDGLVGGHWDNDKNNTDTVLEFDLKNNVFGTDKKAGGTFSKKLVESGFDWD